jgi:TIR domain
MHKIFVSYTQEDSEFAQGLMRALGLTDAIRVPALGDLTESSMSHLLREQMEKARAVLVLISDKTVKSSWVMFGIGLAQFLGKKIIPILLPAAEINESILSFISGLRPIDARNKTILEVAFELSSVLLRLDEFWNPFQDKIATWRIRQAWEQVETIQKGVWELEAKTPTAYVVDTLTAIMDMLEEGDEYLSITNSYFWLTRAIGESSFLRANVEAARRGVIIKIVFLIDAAVLNHRANNSKVKAVIKQHKQAMQNVNVSSRGNMIIKVLPSGHFTKDLERFGQFDMARKFISLTGTETGCVVITPRFISPITELEITHLRLTFSKGSSATDPKTKHYVDKFEQAFSAAMDIDAFSLTPVKNGE